MKRKKHLENEGKGLLLQGQTWNDFLSGVEEKFKLHPREKGEGPPRA